MKRIYLSLGSNVGDREENLRTAIGKLHARDLRIRRISSLYETAAVYYLEQPDFLNCVVEADTELLPMRLLLRVSNIERSMGRKRSIPTVAPTSSPLRGNPGRLPATGRF